MNPETIAAIFGGGAAAVMVQSTFRYLTSKKTMTLSNEEILRKEMQDQLDDLKAELKELRGEVVVWKQKYFELYQEHVELRAQLNRKNPT